MTEGDIGRPMPNLEDKTKTNDKGE